MEEQEEPSSLANFEKFHCRSLEMRSQMIKRKVITDRVNLKLEELRKKARSESELQINLPTDSRLQAENPERETEGLKNRKTFLYEQLKELKGQLAAMVKEKEAAVKATGDAETQFHFEMGIIYGNVKAAEAKVAKVEKEKEKLGDENAELSSKLEGVTHQLKKAMEKNRKLEEKNLKVSQEKDELRNKLYDDTIDFHGKLKSQNERLVSVEVLMEKAKKDLEETKSALNHKETMLSAVRDSTSYLNWMTQGERLATLQNENQRLRRKLKVSEEKDGIQSRIADGTGYILPLLLKQIDRFKPSGNDGMQSNGRYLVMNLDDVEQTVNSLKKACSELDEIKKMDIPRTVSNTNSTVRLGEKTDSDSDSYLNEDAEVTDIYDDDDDEDIPDI